ncbi:hypothetical protein COW99_05195 [Candidatus Roizmanbacteria bacterium CG22_combo_CG10-13_8_21_14_all_38_20]|uniref:Type II secretion system protein GspG C-terminal domain-containing protein n=1 Tax=Candidatus Roizmanbacteria bacterium CG22_combo_CG10-13_8_21_14_all_38_20 TaxID=1974862 RepID=A0A2H0BVU1_9BACT|nr:type II secretion system protein [Candidatus Microgenomates bacterium]PIP61160.1 MAG: hypothetical protein COW99_05195 [Candidatus Roizmanbacteria bacterium CG22_combo_CG10-13_8_21_14_all_38_20]PJC31150.1 MAG: hypothetical protein CO050_03860 [Candidatus Roizmanbacteria bacterium CG_4_9_14_0_2_um_filter_38_17]
MNRCAKGFTLIELLVVISIIGLLAASGLASYRGITKRTQYNRAKNEMRQLAELMDLARGESGLTLKEITGNGCSECVCRGADNITSASCLNNYLNVLSTLNVAANGLMTLESPFLDPWGNPYMVNENEGESGGPSCPDVNGDGESCCTDNIHSAGENKFAAAGWVYDADDINLNVPTYFCSPPEGYHHADQNWN